MLLAPYFYFYGSIQLNIQFFCTILKVAWPVFAKQTGMPKTTGTMVRAALSSVRCLCSLLFPHRPGMGQAGRKGLEYSERLLKNGSCE